MNVTAADGQGRRTRGCSRRCSWRRRSRCCGGAGAGRWRSGRPTACDDRARPALRPRGAVRGRPAAGVRAGVPRRAGRRPAKRLVAVALTIAARRRGAGPGHRGGPRALARGVGDRAVMSGIGQVVRSRSALGDELRRRNEELAELRDERAALEVADDRLRVSRQLEALLDERLGGPGGRGAVDAGRSAGGAAGHRGGQQAHAGRHARDRRHAPGACAGPRAVGRADGGVAGTVGARGADRQRRPAGAAREPRAVGVPDRRAPRRGAGAPTPR